MPPLAKQIGKIVGFLSSIVLIVTVSAQTEKTIQIPFPPGTQVRINEVDRREFPKIKVYATVTRSGLPLTGLTSKNFRVREDEIDQSPIKVVPQRQSISAVLLVDVSGSMKESIPAVKQAAVGFVNSLQKGDKIQVTTFHEQVDTIYTLGDDFEAAKAAIWKIHNLDDTALYDGVHAAIESISHVPGRRVVIVLSDGVDDDGYGNQLSARDLDEPLMLGLVANIPVYAIGLGTEMDEGVLKTIAGTTGAEYVNAATKSDLQELYARIGQQLSSQYLIIYHSKKESQSKIEELKLDYVVPSRKPYVSPEPVFNNAGEVTEYIPPKLNEAEKKRLAQMAGVDRMAEENNIKLLEKFIEKEPGNWPEHIPFYSRATGLQVDPENGSVGFIASEDPAAFTDFYANRLIANDWFITDRSNFILNAFKGDLEVEISVEAIKNNESNVSVNYSESDVAGLTMDRNKVRQVIAADGRNVVIAANGGMFKVSGGCNRLTVTGDANQIQCDSVSYITVQGDKNVVIAEQLGQGMMTGTDCEISWKAGLNDAEPTVRLGGQNNKAGLFNKSNPQAPEHLW